MPIAQVVLETDGLSRSLAHETTRSYYVCWMFKHVQPPLVSCFINLGKPRRDLGRVQLLGAHVSKGSAMRAACFRFSDQNPGSALLRRRQAPHRSASRAKSGQGSDIQKYFCIFLRPGRSFSKMRTPPPRFWMLDASKGTAAGNRNVVEESVPSFEPQLHVLRITLVGALTRTSVSIQLDIDIIWSSLLYFDDFALIFV